MVIPLHGGHAHTAAAPSTVSSEVLVVSVFGLVVVAALIGYAISRYAGTTGS